MKFSFDSIFIPFTEGLRSLVFAWKLFLFGATLVLPLSAERWTGQVSALDGHRLIVLKPSDFLAAGVSENARIMRHRATVFGSAHPLREVSMAKVSVRFPGKYQLWVRIGRPRKLPRPVLATLSSSGKVLSQALVNGSEESSGVGGKSAFIAYLDAAQKFSRTIDPRKSNDRIGEDLLTELANSKVQAMSRWADLNRLEDLDSNLPFYWWKLPPVELMPGEYELKFVPQEVDPKKMVVPFVDAGFLTTNIDLPYPFLGEIDAKPASYLRFRIDSFPPDKESLRIGLRAQLHHGPWGAGANLSPNGINHPKPPMHSNKGYTRWYRLQDIENFSSFGAASVSLSINVEEGSLGLTEFAVFPHEDFVLHRIDWNEPDGRRLAIKTDFANFPWSIKTFRDYAREHYRMALGATGNSLFQLSRPPLFFSNGWGNESGLGNDYLVKTLRLLGFNSCAAPDNLRNSRRYGWRKAGGHYWPPVWMPYDDRNSTERYLRHYKREFVRNGDKWGDMGTFQIADEPQEMKTKELSTPLWIYRSSDDVPAAWHDPTGSSELLTRKKDLSNCVLEGILHCGGIFDLRVGSFSGKKPLYGFWSVGKRQNSPVNLVAGVNGVNQQGMSRPGAAPNQRGLPFKIVYQSGNEKSGGDVSEAIAALYCNNQLMSMLRGLPAKGAFAILGGGVKSVSSLMLRPILEKERLTGGEVALDLEKKSSPTEDLLSELIEDEKKESIFVRKDLKRFVDEDWVWGGGVPEAHLGFRNWLRERKLSPSDVGAESWDKVRMMTIRELADTPALRRQYYWSRRYANYLTPRAFALAAKGIRSAAPSKDMKGFVALSGHALYLGKTEMPLDMFELAKYPELTPGVSDWMTSGSWRWDSHQSVAYSVAPFNAGARRYGDPPVNFPMMHCVYPTVFRSYTQLANQCKLISYWTFGPSYSSTEGFWSDNPWSYHAVHKMNNRVSQLDDVIGDAVMRPSRVAMLYSHSTHLWSSADSYADKRAAFLALSHEYFQPELVTEEQVVDGCLRHYDALYVLEPNVTRRAQAKISRWTEAGGLLWACSNSLVRDEFDEPSDMLADSFGIRRKGKFSDGKRVMKAAKDQTGFRPHAVVNGNSFREVAFEGGVVRATYADGGPAWVEKSIGEGRVVYLGHRPGLTYSSQRVSIGGRPVIWGDVGREVLVRPLRERKVSRDLILSKSKVMASALTGENGSVVVLYNMRPKAVEPLSIVLKEDSEPGSVQVFEADRLVDLPFEYVGGELKLSLPSLNVNEGQMILIRKGPARKDSRASDMKARALRLLSSDDPLDLSAGAWFAGFHPDWNQADSIASLLDHSRWEVRRSAVEALGRLGHGPSAERLSELAKSDRDEHVRADAHYALALVDSASFYETAKNVSARKSSTVRLEVLRAVGLLLDQGGDNAEKIALLALVRNLIGDEVPGIRQLATKLYGRLNPETLLSDALKNKDDSGSLAWWANAVAASDEAFSKYLEEDMPGGEAFFFAVCRYRRDAGLVAELKRRFEAGERSVSLMQAVESQRDPNLVKLVFRKRKDLSDVWRGRLAYQLESTFDRGVGSDLNAWSDELESIE